jgi:predicted PurR-regulated permease PerM
MESENSSYQSIEGEPLPDEALVASGETVVSQSEDGSPEWGATTKLVIGLTVVAFGAFLLFRFMNFVGPLLLAFILAYLFYPIAERSKKATGISWRATVTVLYLILLIVLFGSIAIGGLAVIEQVQNLISFLQNAIRGLPAFIEELTAQPWAIGPFLLNLDMLDVNDLGRQVLGTVQPLLTEAGTSVVSLAQGMASVIGWSFFILLISYFILAESGGFRLFSLTIPGYSYDMHRLGKELNRIWNAFLRGQITIVLITIVVYTILLGGLGMKFYFGLALLAGLARFIPYVGPFIAWTSYGLVAFFQGTTFLGMPPLPYVGLVVGLAWIIDVLLDNIVVPRLMAHALRVHPAAVMISALVAFNLLGVIGVVLAAPVLASMKLIIEYIFAKLFDQDPWRDMETMPPPAPLPSVISPLQERYEVLKEGFNRRRRRPLPPK